MPQWLKKNKVNVLKWQPQSPDQLLERSQNYLLQEKSSTAIPQSTEEIQYM